MSELYMLDADIRAFVLRRTSNALRKRIQAVPVMQQVMSVITYAELLYAASAPSS